MRTYKQPTLIWVGSVTTVAVAVTAWSIVADIAAWNVPARAFLMLALLAACAAVAHAYPIRSATDAATYSLTNVFIVAGASVLPASLITPLVFAALLPDSWRQRHRPGALLRLAFNISQASLAAHVAGVWVRTVSGDRMGDVQNLEHIIGLAGAPVLFTLAQALLVGVAIALQSGIPLHRVDTLAPTSLLGDGFVALQGTVVAGLWIAAPALLFFLPPLFLMAHRLTRTAHLAQVAQIDVKTGLHNSRHFEHALKDELAHSVRLKRPVSLVFIDLDHFKRVNDTYGHAAGDFVLSEMARVLQGLVRKEDTLARFGGEEFVVMLPGTDLEEAAYLAERLRSAVEEHEFALEDGRVIRCTASLGVATCPQHGTDMNRLIQEADAAMYRAKRTRNAVARAQGLHVLPRLDAGPASPAEPVTPQRRKEDARQAAQGAPHAPRAGVAILWTTVALGTAAAAVALVQTAQAQVWHVLVPFLVMAALAEVLKAADALLHHRRDTGLADHRAGGGAAGEPGGGGHAPAAGAQAPGAEQAAVQPGQSHTGGGIGGGGVPALGPSRAGDHALVHGGGAGGGAGLPHH
jgi:diguanylate cyclase (GGDEF)-like protein